MTFVRSATAAALAVAVLGAACGKKGAPIPPRVRIPAPVQMITAARLGNDAAHPRDAVALPGVVEQVYYVGQGYRYRVRTADAQVWVHAPERLAEGTATSVVVPRDALLLFPA